MGRTPGDFGQLKGVAWSPKDKKKKREKMETTGQFMMKITQRGSEACWGGGSSRLRRFEFLDGKSGKRAELRMTFCH